MGAFDVEAPDWRRIPAVTVTGAAEVGADGSVLLPTDAGPLRVALLDGGARLRFGAAARDYGILLRAPAALPTRAESFDGGTRLIPFVAAYVDDVDTANARIDVDWQPDY